MGSPPDESAAPAGHDRLTLRDSAAAEPTSAAQEGHRGAIARLGRATRSAWDVIADQTGPLSFVGHRQRQRRADGHRRHQRQGRPARAAARAAPRGQRDRRRRRGRRGRQARRAGRGRTSSSAASTAPPGRPSRGRPSCRARRSTSTRSSTRGRSRDPLIFCTGPGPAQQVDPLIPWLMRETGARTFYLPSADYIWPHVLNRRVRGRRGGQRRVDRRRGVLPPRPHGLRARPSSGSPRAAPTSSSTRSCRPASRRSSRRCTTPASRAAGASSSARTSTRTSSTWCRPRTSRACTAASTTTRPSATRSARSCSRSTTRSIPATPSSRVAAPARASTAACGSGRRR